MSFLRTIVLLAAFSALALAWSDAQLMREAYLKGANTEPGDAFGWSVAISGDTLVVGTYVESSNATGVNGDETNNNAPFSGAVYIFVRSGGEWVQQAYLKASNTEAGDNFGHSVAISGNTVVVGAPRESSNAKGVNGNQADNSAFESGAAYVFVRTGTTWIQQAYLKASNTKLYDLFGSSVSVSGELIVVGAPYTDGTHAVDVGAAYAFVRNGTNWIPWAHLKPSNAQGHDRFGYSVSVSGATLVIGAPFEDSSATGVNGNQADDSALDSGAAYVFVLNAAGWSQQAYIKASNTETWDNFGASVAVAGDTILVGAPEEDSSAINVNGDQADNSAPRRGAAYVFARTGNTWSQQAYLKQSNGGAFAMFGSSVALSGNSAVVGALNDESKGAAYLFLRAGNAWSAKGRITAPNTGYADWFGYSVGVAGDTVVAGAWGEDGTPNNSAPASGAAYVLRPCTIDVSLIYQSNTLTANFTLATQEERTWTAILIGSFGQRLLWQISLPAISAPRDVSISLPSPPAGNISVVSSLSTPEGLTCYDTATINTGGPA